MGRDRCIAQSCGVSAVMEVLAHCNICTRRKTLGDLTTTEMHKKRTKLKECSSGFRTRRKYSSSKTLAALQKSFPASLCLFVVLLCLDRMSTVQGEPSWRAMPQDSDVAIGKNVTIQCGINDRGDLGVLWSRYQADGRMTSLFINDNSWNAPPRYYVVPHNYGYNLVITNATRDDDTKYECNIQKTSMRAEATVVVLGKFSIITRDSRICRLNHVLIFNNYL